jgi:hypothetical protein
MLCAGIDLHKRCLCRALLCMIIARRSVPDNIQEGRSMNILRPLLALGVLLFWSAPGTAAHQTQTFQR